MNEDHQIASPWTPYGIRSDPFFQEPLGPGEAGLDPDSLLVGRRDEVRRLANQILGAGDSASRAVIQGAAGVGKTTVVSGLKAALSPKGVLTYAEPIRIRAETTAESFCVEVLRMLLLIHATSGRAEGGDAEEYWRRVRRMVLGEDVVGRGVTLGPMGGSRQPGRIPRELAGGSLYQEMAEGFERLSEGGAARTLIHVDNLENLTRQETRRAAGLMLDLRDHFFIRHSHWVFAGADDMEEDVFRFAPQTAGIVPLVLHLEPLAAPEVVQMLERRVHHLALPEETPVFPVRPDAVGAMYARYAGDLRNFLRLLSRATQERMPLRPVEPMELPELIGLMAPAYARDMTRRVSEALWAHVRKLGEGRRADEEVRQVDLARATGLTKGPAKDAWDRLRRAGIIQPTRVEGRNQWHRFAGDVTIALGLV